MSKILELGATLGTLASVACVTNEYMVIGFLLGLIANMGWIVWAAPKKAYGIMVVNTVMFVLYLNPLIN